MYICDNWSKLLYSLFIMANTTVVRVFGICSSLFNLSNYVFFLSRCESSRRSDSRLYKNVLGWAIRLLVCTNVTISKINLHISLFQVSSVMFGFRSFLIYLFVDKKKTNAMKLKSCA